MKTLGVGCFLFETTSTSLAVTLIVNPILVTPTYGCAEGTALRAVSIAGVATRTGGRCISAAAPGGVPIYRDGVSYIISAWFTSETVVLFSISVTVTIVAT
jgi:hypothetical protein